jgi:hypothetical protein
MTPTEKGRFCSVCERNLIDFTHFSDDELLRFVKNNNHKICGRFSKNQLDRKIESTSISENKIIQYSKVAGFVLPSLIANETFSQVSYFEKETPLPASREHTYYDDSIKSVEKKNQERFEFKFQVVDSITNEPIPGVYMTCNNGLKRISDIDGIINISIYDSISQFYFEDPSNSYLSKSVKINFNELKTNPFKVVFQLNPESDNELIVVGTFYVKPKWWQVRKRIRYSKRFKN